jgi:hypothetical protein
VGAAGEGHKGIQIGTRVVAEIFDLEKERKKISATVKKRYF